MQEQQLPIPVIMAGGQGRRLQPLTDTLPKPLVPIAGQGALMRILDLLHRHGYREAILSLCYRAEQIRAACGQSMCGVKLYYACEQTPLGTAGGVRQALRQHTAFAARQVLVISGDAVCTFDLAKAYRAHEKSGAAATLLLAHAENVGAFGVVQCRRDGQISAFAEKPSAFGAAWDTVNTGIYFLRPELLQRIPENAAYDFGHDLFPAALRAKERLQGVLGHGFWCDIGTPDAFYRTSFAVARGEIAGLAAAPDLLRGSSLVGKNCRIAADAVLRDSILFDGVTVESGALLDGVIVCEKCHIGARAELRRGTILGSGVSIAPGAVLRSGTKLSANTACVSGNEKQLPRGGEYAEGKTLFDGARCLDDRFSRTELFLFCGGADILFCARFGGALARTTQADRGALLLCHDGRNISACAAELIGAAAAAAGKTVSMLGQGSYPEMQYLCQKTGAALGAYLRFDGGRCTARLCDKNGLYPMRAQERTIFSALFEDTPQAEKTAGRLHAFSGTRALLCGAMQGLCKNERRVPFALRGAEAKRVLGPYFAALGRRAQENAPLCFCLSALGALTVFSAGEEYDAYAITGCLLFHFAAGKSEKKVALPNTAPPYLLELCREKGIAVQTVLHCPCDSEEQLAARTLYAQKPMLHNAVFAAVFLLDLLERSGKSLSECAAAAKLSPLRIRRRASIALRAGEGGALMRMLAQSTPAYLHRGEDAAGLCLSGGALTLYPRRRTALALSADAASCEAAQELLAGGTKALETLLARLRAKEEGPR